MTEAMQGLNEHVWGRRETRRAPIPRLGSHFHAAGKGQAVPHMPDNTLTESYPRNRTRSMSRRQDSNPNDPAAMRGLFLVALQG